MGVRVSLDGAINVLAIIEADGPRFQGFQLFRRVVAKGGVLAGFLDKREALFGQGDDISDVVQRANRVVKSHLTRLEASNVIENAFGLGDGLLCGTGDLDARFFKGGDRNDRVIFRGFLLKIRQVEFLGIVWRTAPGLWRGAARADEQCQRGSDDD